MKIKHDFHIHTRLSICAGPDGGTYDAYMEQFKKEGLTKVGFTDHYWDENLPTVDEPFYAYQNTPHVLGLKREIESKPCIEGIDVFFGAEVEYDPLRHDIALTEKNAEVFDFIVVPNSHTQMTMPHKLYFPYEKHRDFMIEAYEDILNSPLNKKILSMAHPFTAVACPYDYTEVMALMSEDGYRRLFDRTAEKGIAVEINTSCTKSFADEPESKRAAEYLRMFSLARECGVKFTFGSDAHSLKGHERYIEICQAAASLLGLSERDIAKLPIKN
jgi:histidinol phosphatase-like PHP family hydrolase